MKEKKISGKEFLNEFLALQNDWEQDVSKTSLHPNS